MKSRIDIRIEERGTGRALVFIAINKTPVASEEYPSTAKALAFVEDYARDMRETLEKATVAALLQQGGRHGLD